MKLKRKPNGQFLPWRESLESWLPTLMADGNRPSGDALITLAAIETERAAEALENGASYLRSCELKTQVTVEWAVTNYAKAIKRREILIDAWQRLQEVQ